MPDELKACLEKVRVLPTPPIPHLLIVQVGVIAWRSPTASVIDAASEGDGRVFIEKALELVVAPYLVLWKIVEVVRVLEVSVSAPEVERYLFVEGARGRVNIAAVHDKVSVFQAFIKSGVGIFGVVVETDYRRDVRAALDSFLAELAEHFLWSWEMVIVCVDGEGSIETLDIDIDVHSV